MGNFKEDIARCEAFVFDVDGVMTDGGIIPTADGDFIRRYNAKDGYALAYAVKHGYKVCIITGGRGRTLEHRLRMLGIERFYTDCMDKIRAMREYFAEEGIDPANAIYMGYYAPEADGGISIRDASLGIDWRIPEEKIILSEKDTRHPLLRDFVSPFEYNENLYKS